MKGAGEIVAREVNTTKVEVIQLLMRASASVPPRLPEDEVAASRQTFAPESVNEIRVNLWLMNYNNKVHHGNNTQRHPLRNSRLA